jgi:hypothetical protein
MENTASNIDSFVVFKLVMREGIYPLGLNSVVRLKIYALIFFPHLWQ